MILTFGHIYAQIHIDVTEDTYGIGYGGHALCQSIAAARSGAKVALIGALGKDLLGDNISKTLRKEGISAAGIITSDKQTGLITDSHCVSGANSDIQDAQIPHERLHLHTLLCLQNDLDDHLIDALIRRAKENEAKTFVSIHNDDLQTNRAAMKADIIITNNEPTIPCAEHSIIINAMNGGTKGFAIWQNGRKQSESLFDTEHLPCAMTYDAFCGALSAYIQAGLPIERACNLAHHAALLCATAQNKSDPVAYIGYIEESARKTG